MSKYLSLLFLIIFSSNLLACEALKSLVNEDNRKQFEEMKRVIAYSASQKWENEEFAAAVYREYFSFAEDKYSVADIYLRVIKESMSCEEIAELVKLKNSEVYKKAQRVSKKLHSELWSEFDKIYTEFSKVYNLEVGNLKASIVKVIVAAFDLKEGEVLSSDNVRTRELFVFDLKPDSYPANDWEKIKGHKLISTLKAGEQITSGMLTK